MKHRTVTRSIVGVLALALVPSLNLAGGGELPGGAAPLNGGEVGALSPDVPAPAATAEAAVGAGPWPAKMGCVGCIAAGIVLGGHTLWAFLAYAVANGGAAGVCLGACAIGFS